jgi:uncharacterized protein YoxC
MRTTEERLSQTPTAELENLLDHSSEMIEAIRGELDQRTHQHDEIEKIDQLMQDARPKWAEIQSFFALVLKELRDKKDSKE